MQSNGLNIQDVSLRSLAVDMTTFYHDVIRKNPVETDATACKKTLSKLRKKYSNKLRKDDPCAVSFDSVEVRRAYVFHFCPSFTMAAASHFLTFLKGASPEHIAKLALRESLSVCCLGGGPGTEVAAICAVLAEVRKRWPRQNGKPLLVDATIVDSESGWSTTAGDVVDGLSRLVPPSLVKISHFRFVQADLTRDVSEDVGEVLNRSHLVTMTKFLSAIHGPKDAGARAKILQDTTSGMPVDSFLLILDSSGWQSIDAVAETVGSLSWMEPVYGPRLSTYWLPKSAKKVCLKSELYGNHCCAFKSSNKISIWRKVPLTRCNGVMPLANDS